MKQINIKEITSVLQGVAEAAGKAEESARNIIGRVKREKDKALFFFTEEYDGVVLQSLSVSREAIEQAKDGLDPGFLSSVNAIARDVAIYHKKQLPSGMVAEKPGLRITYRFKPFEKVGIYVPGGQVPLISTLLMTIPVAKVAGVKDIFIASPPSFEGGVHPLLLGVAGCLGIEDVFSVGGAQAIAAFAFGTETVPGVDMVAGPGNRYVNAAKKLLYGDVGVDLLAGPSEVVIFADSTANEDFLEADLNAQIEHTDGFGLLLTTSESLGKSLSEKIQGGYWMHVSDNAEAVRVINHIAPEHLQLVCKDCRSMESLVVAGAVFTGEYSPAVLGDYCAGPSHVLPTGRAARFSSGLSVYSFLRSYAVVNASKELYAGDPHFLRLAETEGLPAHCRSLSLRRSKSKTDGKS